MPCITLSSGKTVCFEGNNYSDGGPVNKNKPIQNKGVDINTKPWMKDNDSWFENIAEVIDPTGITSWDDVRRAGNNYGYDSPEAMIEMAGAVPLLGKIGKSGKIISGGFGLLHDVVKGASYLPPKLQKKVIDVAYPMYQKYAKAGGKELDEALGYGSKLIRDNISLLNPSKWGSSEKSIQGFNILQKLGRGKSAYDAATGSKDNTGFSGGFGSPESLQFNGRNVLPDLQSEYQYPDGGEVDLKLNRVQPVEDEKDLSLDGGFHGNLFNTVGAHGSLNYGPLRTSGNIDFSGYDPKNYNPSLNTNLRTNVQVNPKLNVNANLQYDYNKESGSKFNPSFGAKYQVNPNLNVGVQYNSGSPSFSISKKFPVGGKTYPPAYTTDPRKVQAYQDSVSLYNKTKDIENPKYYTNGNPSWYKWKGNTKDLEEFMRKNNMDLDYDGKFPGKIQPTTTNYFGEGINYPVYKKPSQPYILEEPQRKPLEPLQSKEVPRLTSDFEMEPRSIDAPFIPQSSNEESNREYSVRIPTIDINKRQVAPRVNRVLGKNVVNPKNQYQRSIEFGSREVPIIDDYKLNKLMIKMGMEPRFDDGGKTNNTKTITLSTGKVVTIK